MIAIVFLASAKKNATLKKMSVIYTLTGNLLAETTSVFSSMPSMGETVRAKKGKSRFQVGGKGVNVTKAVKMLGFPSVAAIFPAGEIGKICTNFLDGKIDYIAEQIDGQTRQGLVCVDESTSLETTFLGEDIPVSEKSFENILNKIQLKCGDVFAICGSFPAWQNKFAQILKDKCVKAKAFLCADTYGDCLKDMVKSGCDIIKINRKEFLQWQNISDSLDEELFKNLFLNSRNCAKRLFAVTDGANKVLFADNLSGDFFTIKPPKIKEVSPTGCGDIFLASLLTDIYNNKSTIKNAAQIAVKRSAKAAQSSEITF